MTRTMYDALDASVIPTSAEVVGGYLHRVGQAWSAADWNRFPNAKKVTITTIPSEGALCWDAETGDGSPSDLPTFYAASKAQGFTNPWVYCGLNQWYPQLVAIARSHGWSDIIWWVSDATGVAHMVDGLPTQYKVSSQGIPYDLSLIPDSIPGFDTEPAIPVQEDNMPFILATQGQPGLFVSGSTVVPLSTAPTSPNTTVPTITLAAQDYEAFLAQSTIGAGAFIIATSGQPAVLVSGSLRVPLPDDANLDLPVRTLDAKAYSAIVQAKP